MANEDNMVSHLTELRSRLIKSFLVIILVFAAIFFYEPAASFLFELITKPIQGFLPNEKLIYTGVADRFLVHVKICFLASFLLSSPVWLTQIWLFVAPGLYKKERILSVLLLFFSFVLFFSGVSFVYFVVYPIAFKFLLGFATDATALISLKEYLSFFVLTTIVFGLVFEIPIVLFGLSLMGLVKKQTLKKARPYAIVGISVLCAMITPPDVVSMMLLFIPTIILYELGVFLAGIAAKKV
jgi:sec-independent protein translocase protein TatC